MKTFVSLCALALLTNSAFAQSSNFTGLSIGVGMAYSQTKVTEKDPGNSGYSWNNGDTLPQLNITYNFALSDRWLVGLGASYNLNRQDAGTSRGASDLVRTNLDDHSSVYLQPTFALDDRSAIYAKVAYHSLRVETVPVGSSNWNPDRFRTNGLGYGVGYTRLFGKHVFAQGEVQTVTYDNKLLPGNVRYTGPDETIALITLGYKF